MDEAVSYRRRTGHIVGSAITAILGAASIPAIFGMGWLVFALGWSIAAAMMAVSPYGIYLAQAPLHVSDFVDHRLCVA